MKPTDVNPQLPAANLRSPDVKDVVKSSRRKSVTFLDGFDHDELQESTRDSKPTVPLYETKGWKQSIQEMTFNVKRQE